MLMAQLWSGKASLRRSWAENRMKERVSHVAIQDRIQGKSKCKGPEIGMSGVFLRE
jgi:hypothetical protein